MKKKKIAFVQPILSPYSIPRFEELSKNEDLDVYLFLERYDFAHRPGWVVKDVKGCTVEVIGSLVIKETAENIKMGYVVKGVRTIPLRLPKLILKYKPDTVVVCNATEFLFTSLLRPFLHYKIGLIVEDTSHVVEYKNWIVRTIKAFIYRRADFYLSFTNDSIVYLKRIGITESLYRTSWSIDFQYFDKVVESKSIESFKKDHNLSKKVVFIFVGQLIPRKGILNLLYAWKSLPDFIKKNVGLIILGDGPLKKEIQNYIKKNNIPNIVRVDQRPYQEISFYYHVADIFILPTLEDVFGMVVMEAMASGLAILTSKYAGARELVKEGQNGFIFDSANIENIRKTLMRIYKEKEKIRHMGNASLEIIKDYSHEKVMGDLAKKLHTI